MIGLTYEKFVFYTHAIDNNPSFIYHNDERDYSIVNHIYEEEVQKSIEDNANLIIEYNKINSILAYMSLIFIPEEKAQEHIKFIRKAIPMLNKRIKSKVYKSHEIILRYKLNQIDIYLDNNLIKNKHLGYFTLL
jgi:hypothetical protein